MRSRMIATAAIAAAFVMVPAGSALAGSGPAPAPSERSAPGSTAPTPEGNPSSAKASEVCDDAYQIGNTGYIKRDGETIASVKQFYSPECEKNYSYVWLWQSFIDKEDDYSVKALVHDYNDNSQQGPVTWPEDNGQEYWSDGAATVDHCTAAVGVVHPKGSATEFSGQSDKRC